MDQEYQRRLIAEDYARLLERMREGGWEATVDLVGDTAIFVRLCGLGGPTEPYQVKLEAATYPVGPWRVGFIDPAVDGPARLSAPDRDPRYWPYSQLPGAFGGFHVGYPGPYRVFACLPFSTEYFYYHSDQPWRPDVYDLPRVVSELRKAVGRAVHFSRWWAEIFLGQER